MADASPEQRGGGALALAAVFLGAAGFAASLTCVYQGMRNVMLTNGGACASGGPYAINAGQVCGSGDTWLLTGGILAGLLFTAVLLAGTSYYTDDKIVGTSLFLWAALFGALGYNFIDLAMHPPAHVTSGGWGFCGVLFWLMALGGLIPGIYMVAGSFRSPKNRKQDPTEFSPPLVRANVPFVRSMPGDPAYGMTDPTAADAAAKAIGSGQAPPREATADSTFVDPVTGEQLGPKGDS